MRPILWGILALTTMVIVSCTEATGPEAEYDLAGSWLLTSGEVSAPASVSRLHGFWWYGGAFSVFGPEAFNGKRPQIDGSTWSLANDGWTCRGEMVTRDSIEGTITSPEGISEPFTGRRTTAAP